MKIDALLARHPWPWRGIIYVSDEQYVVRDSRNQIVGCITYLPEQRDTFGPALIELVEAYVKAQEPTDTTKETEP